MAEKKKFTVEILHESDITVFPRLGEERVHRIIVWYFPPLPPKRLELPHPVDDEKIKEEIKKQIARAFNLKPEEIEIELKRPAVSL